MKAVDEERWHRLLCLRNALGRRDEEFPKVDRGFPDGQGLFKLYLDILGLFGRVRV